MVENYTKDMKESVYHGAVVSVLAVGYTMLGSELYEFIDKVCIEIHEIHTDLSDATHGFYL